ncbi:MAG TPA: non-homologous end-joining DNA ligase [Bacillota bacterium]|nr:non-homologous end-joining DNA ligase [Bacillota bacterium]
MDKTPNKPPRLPQLRPMLAVAGYPFDSPDFLFEVKWDGIRCLAYLTEETVLYSRNGQDITHRFPELVDLHKELANVPVILDGEIVIMEEDKPSFKRLLARDKLTNNFRIQRAAKINPAVYMVFDILYHKGESQLDRPLLERKQLLANAFPTHPNLRLNEYTVEHGVDFFRAISRLELEGMMAKQLDSPYLPGVRSPHWYKIRKFLEEDMVICGFTREKDENLSSLIVGSYRNNHLLYAGRVGSGLEQYDSEEMRYLLESLRIDSSPLANSPAVTSAEWVVPELVCSVKYLEKLNNGEIRHACFNGLRPEKEAAECRLN